MWSRSIHSLLGICFSGPGFQLPRAQLMVMPRNPVLPQYWKCRPKTKHCNSYCVVLHNFPLFYLLGNIWATSWENLFMPYANNKGADQSAHPRNQISAFVVRCLDSIIRLVSISEISRLQTVSVAVQASLSLTWSKIPKTGFLVTMLSFLVALFHRRSSAAA